MVPDLSEAEFQSLKAAIREAGRVFVPVVVTTDDEVIDGKGRVRAAAELGIKDYPREVVHGLDSEARHLMRLSLNCVRRHLSGEQKGEAVRAALRSLPHLSNSYLGEMTGVSDKTVAAAREELEQLRTIPKLTEFKGKDGKTRPRHLLARTLREQREATDALVRLGSDAPTRLMTAREAVRKAKRVEAAVARATRPVIEVPHDALAQVHHCDFRQMPVEPGSARLIFTDPLYHREHLPLFSELARWAAGVLQPGGLLVTYFGNSYLPEVLQMLGPHLGYVWQCSNQLDHERVTIHDRKVRTGWKPLLVYCNGEYLPREWLVDVVNTAKEKDRHVYQQSETTADYFVRRLTCEGDLVLDPFCGSGTTVAACKRLNRRCVTTDIDPSAVATARQRVAQTRAGDLLIRPKLTLAPMPPEPGDFESAIESLSGLPA